MPTDDDFSDDDSLSPFSPQRSGERPVLEGQPHGTPPTQNQIANLTPITAETLRRIFEPHVLDQIRNAVRQIELESEPYEHRWIALDVAPPSNEVELEQGVEELVHMGQPDDVQRRYRILVRETWGRGPPDSRDGDQRDQIRSALRHHRHALRELQAFIDDLVYGTTESSLLRGLGVEGDSAAPRLSTAIVYDENGNYEPPVSSWQRVRYWFVPNPPVPGDAVVLAEALLELAWLRHTRHQANQYTLYARSVARVGGDNPTTPYSLAWTFAQVVQQIVDANQVAPNDLGDEPLGDLAGGHPEGLTISYDARGVHQPLDPQFVRRWFVLDRHFPADECDLINALDELDGLGHLRVHASQYRQICRELWRATRAHRDPDIEGSTAYRLRRVVREIAALNSQIPADPDPSRPSVVPIQDVLARRLQQSVRAHRPTPAPSGSKMIAETPLVPKDPTALDAILGDDWGDESSENK